MTSNGAGRPPRRVIALLLAVVGPTGAAHYYAGFKERALLWFGALHLAVIVVSVSIVTLGGVVPLAALGHLLVLLVVVSWVGPVVDLLVLKLEGRVRPSLWSLVLWALGFVIAAAAVRAVVRTTLIEAFKTPSSSMAPTLLANDHVYVDKAAYGPVVPFTGRRLFGRLPPGRGDMIVFEFPELGSDGRPLDFIKRVIAVEGDTLELDQGHPILNGWKVPRCHVGRYALTGGAEDGPREGELYVEFLGENSYLVWLQDGWTRPEQGPYVVRPGEVWVLGDNRNSSSDSPSWNGGKGAGVPHEKIKGSVELVWFALKSGKRVDWERLGTSFSEAPRLPRAAPAELHQNLTRCLDARPEQRLPPRGRERR